VVAEAGEDALADDRALLALFRAIASGDEVETARMVDRSSALARKPISGGATRSDPDRFFFVAIRHYIYAGDTALHIAAAAHRREIAAALVASGANARARNRRGAEPLHYVADGWPEEDVRDSAARTRIVADLINAGAEPNVFDTNGSSPLHRAVRNRTSPVVQTLVEHGADPLLRNGSGLTPLHLAVQNTGRSGSGSASAKLEQGRIITLLLEHGARPTDVDAMGRTVIAAAASDWIRGLLQNPE
jgi:ankyrin repeat protein